MTTINNETTNTENNDINEENDMLEQGEDQESQELEADIAEDEGVEASADDADDSTETVVEASASDAPAKEPVKEKGPPAYLAFVAAAKAHAEALGLQMKDQKGFFQIWNATTGHKLYVAKQGREVTRIDTSLPMSALDGISLPLSKPNGRIVCHVSPTLEAVTLALDVLSTHSDKIPSPKKAAKAKVEPTPAAE